MRVTLPAAATMLTVAFLASSVERSAILEATTLARPLLEIMLVPELKYLAGEARHSTKIGS